MELLIVIADSGPLLHLHWVGASEWALPPMTILVPAAVVAEVRRYAPEVLADPRVLAVDDPEPSPQLEGWSLGAGETAAITLGLSHQPRSEVRLLCDDMQARSAAESLGLEAMGSIGLILRAFDAGRVDRAAARAALQDLPFGGRLHLHRSLLAQALRALEGKGR